MNAVTKMTTTDARELQPVAQATPAYLLQLAVQQGADLDRLEKLMALQERWEANEARKAFVDALTAFKAEPITIDKRKHVQFENRSGDVTSYNHAELSDVTDAICPALAKHGLSHRWNVLQADGRITVECILTHALGHAERIAMSAPPDASGGKNTIQQIASTVTYLQRYTLLAITGVATKGQDDDGRGAQPQTPEFDVSWLDKVRDMKTKDERAAVKAEMIKQWGDAVKIPKALMSAYNERVKALRGAGHE